jgi:RNA polymerase sigma factor (sigma-70 family)
MALTLGVTQPAPSLTEHELVAAVRRGSDRAFEELYSRYRGRIGSYAFGMVGDHARAEDIAQEVFISALRRLRDTERPIAFKPWIYEIAKNACIDEFRRTRRSREVPLDADDDDGEGEGESRGLLSQSPTPDAAVENKQRLDDLRGAFHGLSESHHRIIVMRELEGLSYSQIGDRLGMSKAVVESTLFRARRRLGEEYDELVSGRRCERVQTVIAMDGERSLRSLGIRDRRQLARHLSHCQPCRHHARMAGVDESLFKPGLRGKIAALLPFPWLRWRRSRSKDDAIAASGSNRFAAMKSMVTVAQVADPSAPAFGLGRATAAAAAIVIAATGGGIVSGLHHGQFPPRGGTAGSSAAPARAVVRGVRSGPGGPASPSAGNRTAASAGSSGPSGSGGPGAATHGGPAAQSPTGTAATGQGGGLGGLPQSIGGLVGGKKGPNLPKLPGVSLPGLPGLASSGSNPLKSVLPPLLPQLPKVSIPKPPAVTVPPLVPPQLPQLPKVNVPKTQLPQLPKVPVPKTQLPPLPKVPVPKTQLPPLPKVTVPVPKPPSVTLPPPPRPQAKISTPKLPSVTPPPKLPSVTPPPKLPSVTPPPKLPSVTPPPQLPSVTPPPLPSTTVPNPQGLLPLLGQKSG